jgi:Amt family ammonium transporter
VEPRLATNVLFKNMVDSSVVALAFWLLGYGLAFGEPSSAFAGLGEFCLIGTAPAALAYVFFQYSFSATTATIISGGTAGRMRVLGYLIFTLFVGALLHPLVAHWIWAPSGFLKFGGRNAVFGLGFCCSFCWWWCCFDLMKALG